MDRTSPRFPISVGRADTCTQEKSFQEMAKKPVFSKMHKNRFTLTEQEIQAKPTSRGKALVEGSGVARKFLVA
jgi:hypothetical protein